MSNFITMCIKVPTLAMILKTTGTHSARCVDVKSGTDCYVLELLAHSSMRGKCNVLLVSKS